MSEKKVETTAKDGEWVPATADVCAGDQVKLPSGGPVMTVLRVTPPSPASSPDDHALECAWFEDATATQQSVMHRETFPHASLLVQKPKPAEKPPVKTPVP